MTRFSNTYTPHWPLPLATNTNPTNAINSELWPLPSPLRTSTNGTITDVTDGIRTITSKTTRTISAKT